MQKQRAPAVESLLTRGVSHLVERAELRRLLMSGKTLRVKLGIDPTAPDLHIGHAVVLSKLREFQDLGHTIVLIIGDFTGRIGDPSGRASARKPLSEAEIKANMKNYLAQAAKIINIRKSEIRWNSEWHKKGGLAALLELARSASVQQILKREDFKKRLAERNDVTMLELLYPLFQGYDSVAVRADVELGGDDQLLNLLMGRRVERHFGMKEQQVLTTPLLVGLDGVQKMSKSLGNYIGMTDNPDEMFGKVMSVPDAAMPQYYELCTDIPEREYRAVIKQSRRDAKVKLAKEIVGSYHGAVAAQKAAERFSDMFSKKELFGELEPLRLRARVMIVADLIIASRVVKSKSEAWRLVKQSAVSVAGSVKTDPREVLTLQNGDVVKIGKRRFFRVKI